MKKILTLVISLMLMLTISIPAFAKENGFNANGNNYTARLYNGFYYPNLQLVMKWSKDWTPQANEPIGAWCTNHYTWYSNDYSEDTWYGYDTLTTYGKGTYKVEEFSKIMSVSDDQAAWTKYEAAGAYDAGWGAYTDGVPRYVVYEDTLNVYNISTGKLVYTANFIQGVNKRIGKPIF